MTPTARVRANRRNAERSTGPTTPAGKARVSQNARRHGLAAPLDAGLSRAPEIISIAKRIAGPDAANDEVASACAIAEAQIDLLRIRSVRRALQERLTDLAPAEAERSSSARARLEPQADFAGLIDALGRLERYERRALSRRKFAIRRYDAARRVALARNEPGS